MLNKNKCDHFLGIEEFEPDPSYNVHECDNLRNKLAMDIVFQFCPYCGKKLSTQMTKGKLVYKPINKSDI